ncbi:putative zinc finger protein [Orchesella cincta]|uniref:Putative zinc finger protein n=1 Tax=Orchesella cincta TaxID=48709 RepID=A0A1D2MAU1_ORCCI|nr:putative zinc finger protein [Orchesella cincta]
MGDVTSDKLEVSNVKTLKERLGIENEPQLEEFRSQLKRNAVLPDLIASRCSGLKMDIKSELIDEDDDDSYHLEFDTEIDNPTDPLEFLSSRIQLFREKDVDEAVARLEQNFSASNFTQKRRQNRPIPNSSEIIKAETYSWSPLKLPSAQLHERFKCTICGITTRWKANLARHMALVRNFTAKVIKTTQKNQLIKRRLTTKPRVSRKAIILSCADCPYKTKFAQRFENHPRLQKLGADAVACHICGWLLRPNFVSLHQVNCHSETVKKVADR